MKVVIQVKVLLTDQSRRLEVFDDGVLSDWQMELIPAENEPVVDGVAHQVDAGSHDKSDHADIDCRARQRLRTALNQLMTRYEAGILYVIQRHFTEAELRSGCCLKLN